VTQSKSFPSLGSMDDGAPPTLTGRAVLSGCGIGLLLALLLWAALILTLVW
jgi:hypothetical protein